MILLSYRKVETEAELNKDNIRILTWSELLYIITHIATTGKRLFNTRYPVVENGSIFPTKTHLQSTIPSRQVNLKFFSVEEKFPHYPIIGNKYFDSFTIHSCKLKGLGADFDGDMMNGTGVMSNDGNEEINNYMNSYLSAIDSNFKLIDSVDTVDVKYVLQNITRI